MSHHHDSHLEGMIPHEMIATRAHQLWVARGCPEGQPEVDWFAARKELEEELTPPVEVEGEVRPLRKKAA